jgi:hypothetical protein
MVRHFGTRWPTIGEALRANPGFARARRLERSSPPGGIRARALRRRFRSRRSGLHRDPVRVSARGVSRWRSGVGAPRRRRAPVEATALVVEDLAARAIRRVRARGMPRLAMRVRRANVAAASVLSVSADRRRDGGDWHGRLWRLSSSSAVSGGNPCRPLCSNGSDLVGRGRELHDCAGHESQRTFSIAGRSLTATGTWLLGGTITPSLSVERFCWWRRL